MNKYQMVTLPFDDGHVALQIDERGWCEVTIVAPQHRRHFGADSIGAIARSIFTRLPNRNPIGVIQEVSVINLLNVSEPHGSVYLEVASKPERQLFFQDKEANVIHTTFVSTEQLGFWESKLSVFRNQRMTLSDA